MKILLTIHEKLDPNSGSAGSTWKIGQQYQKLGHEVQYYSIDNLPQRLPDLAKKILFPEFVATHISTLSKQQVVDVVDASIGDTWIWAKVLQNFRKKRPLLVTRSHGLRHLHHLYTLEELRRGNLPLSWKYPLYRGSIRLWEESTTLRNADLVYLLNHQEAKYAIDVLGVKPERLHVFPNGIPEEFLGLCFEPTPTAENSVIRIAQIGTYIPRKGIHYSVPALNKILTRYPEVQVSFFGTECRECPSIVQVYEDFDPAVRDRVQVLPRYSHETLPTLLKGHQIKILPSISEGFGKALIEAMACGLAPITTATSGPMEIIQDGHDGIIVPTHESWAIEQALERLIQDRLYLEKLRRNSYTTAQHYNWQRIAQARLSLYEEALSQRKYSKETS